MKKYDKVILTLNIIRTMMGVFMTYYAASIPSVVLTIISIGYTLMSVKVLISDINEAGKQ